MEKTFSGQNLCSCAFGANIRSDTKQRARHRTPFLQPPPRPSFRGRPCHPPPPLQSNFQVALADAWLSIRKSEDVIMLERSHLSKYGMPTGIGCAPKLSLTAGLSVPHNYEFRWAVISNHPVVGKKWSRLIYDEVHATATGNISNHLLCHTQTVWAVTGTPITKNVESSLARLLGLLCGDSALSTKVHKEMAHIMVR